MQTNIHIPDTNKHHHPPLPTSISISLTHWQRLVALRRDWGRCVPLNMHRRLSEDDTGMLAYIEKDSPLYFRNTEYLPNLCICLWHSMTEHPLHLVSSTLFQHVLLLCHSASLHYPQACCLLCIHVTSCSTVCVTHSLIPSHSQGHDAHWPKSLEIPLVLSLRLCS